jgi:hypothetical protein
MVLWFMRKYSNDPILFKNVCDYPPLKRTWTSFEKNLNSHHARNVCTNFDCLIEIGQMFYLKRFFPIYKCKISFPSFVPILDHRRQ